MTGCLGAASSLPPVLIRLASVLAENLPKNALVQDSIAVDLKGARERHTWRHADNAARSFKRSEPMQPGPGLSQCATAHAGFRQAIVIARRSITSSLFRSLRSRLGGSLLAVVGINRIKKLEIHLILGCSARESVPRVPAQARTLACPSCRCSAETVGLGALSCHRLIFGS